jgi:hypothetical protein
LQGLPRFFEQRQHAPVQEVGEPRAALGQGLDLGHRNGQYEHVIDRGIGRHHRAPGQGRSHREHVARLVGEDALGSLRSLLTADRALSDKK